MRQPGASSGCLPPCLLVTTPEYNRVDVFSKPGIMLCMAQHPDLHLRSRLMRAILTPTTSLDDFWFREGYEAYVSVGNSVISTPCPYPFGSSAAINWHEGVAEARNDYMMALHEDDYVPSPESLIGHDGRVAPQKWDIPGDVLVKWHGAPVNWGCPMDYPVGTEW
jgi:hypothetical protein